MVEMQALVVKEDSKEGFKFKDLQRRLTLMLKCNALMVKKEEMGFRELMGKEE